MAETTYTDDNITQAYAHLRARRVDLVGDYAGDELFLVEGDSMLLHAFEDDRLDFDSGFQILHAVYNVERLLSEMIRRKCNFHIVFFESNRHLVSGNRGSLMIHCSQRLTSETVSSIRY